MSSSSLFAFAFFCSHAIALDAFCAAVRGAGAGRGLRMGLIGFRAAHVVLLDSVSGAGASGDGSQESDGAGDGDENGNEGGSDGTGRGRASRAHSAGSMSSLRIVEMGIVICSGSDVDTEVVHGHGHKNDK
jgi:hypothetical protein